MKKKPDTTLPHVSFIIPTLNAQHILPACLGAIRAQSYPQKRIEILVSDGGSTDDTVNIAKQFGARVIKNPEILHEPGKSRASAQARGTILFYTDADNILSHANWLKDMVAPYLHEKNVVGYLPQTIPAPDTNPIDRYLGYLFTDPFTWFVYYPAANPAYLDHIYKPLKKTSGYILYKFPSENPPLFGLSQGVGTTRSFKRTDIAHADDMLAGIKLISEGGVVAYVPSAGIYHYHVSDLANFIRKYSWRVRNNISQEVKGMGLVHRIPSLPLRRKLRIVFYLPYSFSLVFPFVDSLRLAFTHRDAVMLLHAPMTVMMSIIIIFEFIRNIFRGKEKLPTYS